MSWPGRGASETSVHRCSSFRTLTSSRGRRLQIFMPKVHPIDLRLAFRERPPPVRARSRTMLPRLTELDVETGPVAEAFLAHASRFAGTFRARCEEQCVSEKPVKILSDGPEVGDVEGAWVLIRVGSRSVWLVCWIHKSNTTAVILLLCIHHNIMIHSPLEWSHISDSNTCQRPDQQCNHTSHIFIDQDIIGMQ